MTGYNLILIYSPDGSEILMCRRQRPPYLGLSNLVGGHIEPGEGGEEAAYRELAEETGNPHGDNQLVYPANMCGSST